MQDEGLKTKDQGLSRVTRAGESAGWWSFVSGPLSLVP
jgi:hypothetical protein